MRFTGRIVGNKQESSSDLEYGTKNYHPIIEYKNAEGEIKGCVGDIGSAHEYPVGQDIGLTEFHDKTIVDMPLERSLLKVFGIVFGILALVVGMYNYQKQ
jgi:hypothetical protein